MDPFLCSRFDHRNGRSGLAGQGDMAVSLVKETWLDNSEVRLITYGFGGISGGIIALGILGGIANYDRHKLLSRPQGR